MVGQFSSNKNKNPTGKAGLGQKHESLTQPTLEQQDRRDIASVSPVWEQTGRKPLDDTALIGVGRFGGIPRTLGYPGVSRATAARIRDLGVSRLRENRPGIPGSGKVISRQDRLRRKAG